MKRRERIGAVDEELSSEDHHEVARQQEYSCRRQEVRKRKNEHGVTTRAFKPTQPTSKIQMKGPRRAMYPSEKGEKFLNKTS